jgi:cAMP-dependent protein kinase regulator
MTDQAHAATSGSSPVERAWALGLISRKDPGARDEALRVALSVIEKDPFQLTAVALVVQLLIDAGRKATAADAAAKLVDAYVRRGDLPAATAASIQADRAGGDGAELRKAIALAFGRGSKRIADVSPLPPPLPVRPGVDPELAALRGDALLARAEACLSKLIGTEDPASHGLVPALPLFSALEASALERLLGAFESRDLAVEELAIEQGAEGREAFVVVRGVLRAERTPPTGQDEGAATLLAVLGPGAIFGEMALVSEAPRAASVIAQEPSTVLVASREALEGIAASEPAIGRELGSFCRSRMIANLVRTSALLRAIPAEDREQVMALFQARTFQEGEILFREGSEPEGLYLLASGGVRVMAADPSGGEDVVVADLGPGDVVGEISIVLRRPATGTVVAAYPTVALELSRDAFQEAIRRHPSVLTELYQLATARQDELRSVVAQQALDVEEAVLV